MTEQQAKRLQEIEDAIQELHEAAEPYRALHEDDPAKGRLTWYVDAINSLRHEESTIRNGKADVRPPRAEMRDEEGRPFAPNEPDPLERVQFLRRKPGRPRKTA